MTGMKNKNLILGGAMAICTLFQDEINEKKNRSYKQSTATKKQKQARKRQRQARKINR